MDWVDDASLLIDALQFGFDFLYYSLTLFVDFNESEWKLLTRRNGLPTRSYLRRSPSNPQEALKHMFLFVVEKRPVPLDYEQISAVGIETSEQERREVFGSISRREDKDLSRRNRSEAVAV